MFSLKNIQNFHLVFCFSLFFTMTWKVFANTNYWDTDGSSSLSADWSSSNWNLSADGDAMGAYQPWNDSYPSSPNYAIFSASTDANGSSTIAADLDVTLLGITVEEGDITISADDGSITLSGNADFNVADGSTLSVNEPVLYSGYTLDKTGKGLLTFGGGVGGATTINQGKIDIASGLDLSSGVFTGTSGAGSSKSVIGGLGTVDSVTIGSDNGEIDFISPGLGYSTSLSNASSLKQKPSERSSGAVGKFTIDTLNWNGGGVYDWEIKTFTKDNSANHTKFDVLSVGTINFNDKASDAYTVNIMSVSNDAGAVGAVTNPDQTWQDHLGTNGFKFLTATNVTGMSETGNNVSDFFNIRADDFYYTNNNWYGTWDVYRSGNDFYLTYSVAPEPSTYVMISALFLFIGGNRSSRKSIRSIFSILKNKFAKKDNSQTTAVSS
jgi:hypothetical protein